MYVHDYIHNVVIIINGGVKRYRPLPILFETRAYHRVTTQGLVVLGA